MAKSSKKSEKKYPRRGGSTFIGILIGLVLGLVIALGVAWYINKLPNPFRDKSSPPKAVPPPYPAKDSATAPKVTAPDKPAPKEPVAKDTGTADQASTDKKSTSGARETFFVQAGSFQSAAEAEGLKARLALLGLEATLQTRNLPDKGVWHRVRLGPYTDVEELNRIRDALKQNNIDAALVKVRDAE